jgi:arginine utilization protein RocB
MSSSSSSDIEDNTLLQSSSESDQEITPIKVKRTKNKKEKVGEELFTSKKKTKGKKKQIEEFNEEIIDNKNSVEVAFEQITEITDNIMIQFTELKTMMDEFNKSYKKAQSDITKLKKSLVREFTKLEKNQKVKTTRTFKAIDVPPQILNFLELESDTKMTRQQVSSQINSKFKEEGMVVDGKIKLTPKACKALGLEKGTVLNKGMPQITKFMKPYYDKMASSSA